MRSWFIGQLSWIKARSVCGISICAAATARFTPSTHLALLRLAVDKSSHLQAIRWDRGPAQHNAQVLPSR
jgi:hypothetical protein